MPFFTPNLPLNYMRNQNPPFKYSQNLYLNCAQNLHLICVSAIMSCTFVKVHLMRPELLLTW